MTAPVDTQADTPLLRDAFPWMAAVLFLLLHVPGITHAPLDDHAWRQADTASVARNFLEEDSNILFPRVDTRGAQTGITGMEFPAVNALMALVHAPYGWTHWGGRVVVLVLCWPMLLYVYALVRRRHDVVAARAATWFMATSPLFFFNARQLQPDAVMLTLSVAALFHVDGYAREGRRQEMVLGAALLGWAMLVKVTAAVVGIPMLVMLWRARRLDVFAVACAVLLALVPAGAWYVHAHRLSEAFGLAGHFNLDENPTRLLDPSYWLHVFILRIPSSVATVPGAALALVGCVVAWRTRRVEWLAWLAGVAAYQCVFADKTYHHVYYSLPMTAPLAVLAGVGAAHVLAALPRHATGLTMAALLLVPVNTAARVHGWYTLRQEHLLELEAFVEPWIPPNRLVVVNGGPSPSMMYFAHRKGWSATHAEMTTEWLAMRHVEGARFLVLDRRMDSGPVPPLPSRDCLVVREGDVEIRKLEVGCF